MEKYQRCTRCVMDNVSDSSIRFDDQGHCNYCTDVLRRMPEEYFPNAEGKQKLEAMLARVKEDCKDDPYDCIVGVSGGIDSSYILYLGAQYGLRMLAVHIDDGFDNEIAVENLRKLTEKTGTEMITIHADRQEYMDVVRSFLEASVANLAFAQDNLIIKALHTYAREHHIKYSLDGNNFAHECILERGDSVNAADKKLIYSIHKRFGRVPLKNLEFMSLEDRYIRQKFGSPVTHLRPLNYLDYNLEEAIHTLEDYCGFVYYGGKHYESILTRFMQCWYLPEKFGQDKRKSHYSSLIMTGQMTREEALENLKKPLYASEELLQKDRQFLADCLGITLEQLDAYVKQAPKSEMEYPHSLLNHAAPLARKLRRFIE